ncbi:MAG TPA: S9 family peptidase, partial [Acidobacteriota bacterium]|nr:S9 family peptidase [Acidobacteriota bacterium]
MQKNIIRFCILLLFVSLCLFAADKGSLTSLKKIQYPSARTVDVVDDYHGTKVSDPYRWLENPDSPETREWIAAENKITFQFLESIS